MWGHIVHAGGSGLDGAHLQTLIRQASCDEWSKYTEACCFGIVQASELVVSARSVDESRLNNNQWCQLSYQDFKFVAISKAIGDAF